MRKVLKLASQAVVHIARVWSNFARYAYEVAGART